MRRTSLIFLCVTLFCGLFSAVYEHFSHGVYSNYMVYLFMFPFFGGLVPYALFGLVPKIKCPSPASARIFNSGVAALAVGSCIKGVLDIYGTSSSYQPIYWVLGVMLVSFGVVMFVFNLLFPRQQNTDAPQALITKALIDNKKRLLQNESFAAAIFFCVYVRKCGKTSDVFQKTA